METNLEPQHLRIRFALGTITLIAGLIGGVIALFQWTERIGVYYLFGDYTRYVLGFGSFAAMIFGAILINDSWVHWRISKGLEYRLLNQAAHQTRILDFAGQRPIEEEHSQKNS